MFKEQPPAEKTWDTFNEKSDRAEDFKGEISLEESKGAELKQEKKKDSGKKKLDNLDRERT